MKLLVTGAGGFIGYHTVRRLLDAGHEVIGIDNLNDYYDPLLKEARLNQIAPHETFIFVKTDVADRAGMQQIFDSHSFDAVIHLAAQAGVRYSITNPYAYIDSNLVGFGNIVEGCRRGGVKHLVYASSSSVYGLNQTMPFSTSHGVDHPVSLYAATKRANELMAHTYSHLYQLPTTGLRFFTVYGPWGRPDMALMTFASRIMKGEPIDVYNNGEMERDWTYVDDVVAGIEHALHNPPAPEPTRDMTAPHPGRSSAPYRIFNVGGGSPVKLISFIRALETALGREAKINFMPLQQGDVLATHADISDTVECLGFAPRVSVEEGIAKFAQWFKEYYR